MINNFGLTFEQNLWLLPLRLVMVDWRWLFVNNAVAGDFIIHTIYSINYETSYQRCVLPTKAVSKALTDIMFLFKEAHVHTSYYPHISAVSYISLLCVSVMGAGSNWVP